MNPEISNLVRKAFPVLDATRRAKAIRWITILVEADSWKKPALLIDGGMAFLLKRQDELRTLLDSVQHLAPMRLVRVDTDVFVANLNSLLASLRLRLQKPDSWVCVDVSKRLSRPDILSKSTDLCRVIEAVLRQCQNSTSTELVLATEGFNLTTVFGILLDYPAVFYFDRTSHDTDSDTCLSGHELLNCKVTMTSSSEDFVLQSFSYPTNLESDIGSVVQQWFDRHWGARQDIKLSSSAVTLDSIAL